LSIDPDALEQPIQGIRPEAALSRLPFRATHWPQPWPLLLRVPWYTTNPDCGSSAKIERLIVNQPECPDFCPYYAEGEAGD